MKTTSLCRNSKRHSSWTSTGSINTAYIVHNCRKSRTTHTMLGIVIVCDASAIVDAGRVRLSVDHMACSAPDESTDGARYVLPLLRSTRDFV